MTNEKKFRKHVIKAAGTYKVLLDDHRAIGDSVQKMSSLFGISRNVLQQSFKKLVGKGVREYKLLQRMERAKQLLAEGTDIKDIAEQLHYTKPRAFSTAFKRYYGVSPSQYANTLTVLYNGDKHIQL